MRIISGRLKGRRFPSLMVRGIRPTADRVRESVFSALGQAIEGRRILDLFAGTGSFGFEALSRGAASVVFVEKNRQMASSLATTSELFGVLDQVEILPMDATHAAKKLRNTGDKFGIIFIDPPYEARALRDLQGAAVLPLLLCQDGLLVVETGHHPFEPCEQGIFSRQFERKYGNTFITIFHIATGAS